MTQHFFLPGPLPSLNEIIAAAKQHTGSWNAYADMKRLWSGIVIMEAKQQRLRPMVGPVHFHFQWHERDRRRDPDNISSGGRKLTLDGLIAAGILPGDGWRHISGWTDAFSVDTKRPGVWIEMTPIGGKP